MVEIIGGVCLALGIFSSIRFSMQSFGDPEGLLIMLTIIMVLGWSGFGWALLNTIGASN